jgi:acetyl-CoA C-acetyltransferase
MSVVPMFRGAELMCEKWGLTREELDRYAYESHQRAAKAIADGRFKEQIAPIAGVEHDEGPRPDSTLAKLAELKTLRADGRITAATSSQISDGSGALLIASEAAVRTHGLTPRARIVTLTLTGDDPVYMLTAPIPATRKALAKAGLTVGDIAVTEINEAFAPVPLAWLRELDADPATTNPNGGAIALGHPLGGTGAILMTKLLHELERVGGRYGLQTMCEGGGQANVTIIERL